MRAALPHLKVAAGQKISKWSANYLSGIFVVSRIWK
jgi:hypothetical protein